MALQLTLGIGLALAVSALAYRAQALSAGGALAASAVGAMTFGLGGWVPSLMLLTFFVSSSFLSRLGKQRKLEVGEKFSKGARRDQWQVLANGSLAALFSLLQALAPSQSWTMAGIAGALAAVTADTWATEIGVLGNSRPRLLTTWKVVPPGTSGAVTWEGTLASVSGALVVGSLAGLAGGWELALAALLGGAAGSVFDSLLGASVQARYHCDRCEAETEKHPLHGCGAATHLVGGWAWLGNDLVNLFASSVGAGLGILIIQL